MPLVEFFHWQMFYYDAISFYCASSEDVVEPIVHYISLWVLVRDTLLFGLSIKNNCAFPECLMYLSHKHDLYANNLALKIYILATRGLRAKSVVLYWLYFRFYFMFFPCFDFCSLIYCSLFVYFWSPCRLS